MGSGPRRRGRLAGEAGWQRLESPSMPRPSLTIALSHLAELRARRDRLTIERRRVVIGEAADRGRRLREIDAERLEVEVEIRQARGVADVLRTRRVMASAS